MNSECEGPSKSNIDTNGMDNDNKNPIFITEFDNCGPNRKVASKNIRLVCVLILALTEKK